MNVLLVDDDIEILELLTEMLTHLGYTVNSTNDPKHALQLFREFAAVKTPFDIVLTDFHMPCWSGLTLAMHIASCCTLYEIKAPVICITGNATDARRMNEASRSPIALILEKGCAMKDLDNAIKQTRAKAVANA